jgi:hypothetical protein
MLETMSVDTPAMPSASDALTSRMRQLKRAYQRALKRRPTEIERTAMERAARLTVRAEAAALDPNATLDDVVRVDNAAARARAKLSDLIGLRRKPTPTNGLDLSGLLRPGRDD